MVVPVLFINMFVHEDSVLITDWITYFYEVLG